MRFFVGRFVIPLGTKPPFLLVLIVREDFRAILARSGKSLDVKLLLSALQQTLEFEYYLEKRFAQTVLRILCIN